MRRISRALFALFALPLATHAQSVSGSVSTSYNNVTVTGSADAGWSNDFDPNCGFGSVYDYLPYTLNTMSYQVDSGPVSYFNWSQQTSFAVECQGTPDNIYSYRLSYTDQVPGNREVVITAPFGDGTSNATAYSTQSYSIPGAIAQPKYYIVAILYVPPGNSSTNGFGESASNGTTDSVSKTFTNDVSTTFGGSLFGSAEWTYGTSTQNGSSQAFQETHTASYAHSLPATQNVIDHSGEQPDILACTFADFQNPTQMSPSCQCQPYTLGNATVPGVCSICANPSSCTAADFQDIVNADEMASTNLALSPTNNWCTSDNRYCYTNVSVDLPDGSNNSFTASDSSLTTQTFSQQVCHYVGYKDGGNINILGAFSLSINDMTRFTWCDSQTTGSTNGTSNQAAVNLGSKTSGCTFGVDIYEDTVYHTFLLEPSGGTYPSACNGQ